MKRYCSLFLAVLILLLSLTGCTPELHERLLISAIGVDLADDGYRITVRAAPSLEGEAELCLSGEGKTVPEALDHIALLSGQQPLYSHNTMIIFGMACAERGLDACIDFFIRHYDARPTVQLFLSESTAEDILIPAEETSNWTSRQLAQLAKSETFSGLTISVNLLDFVNQIYGLSGSALLPVLRQAETPELCGTGLLKGSVFQQMLSDSAIQGYLTLAGQLQAGTISVWDGEYGEVSITTNETWSAIHFTGTEEAPRFSIEIQTEGEISSVSNGTGQLDNTAFSRLEQAYASVVFQNIQDYLAASVYAAGIDASALCRSVLRDAPEVWKAVSYDTEAFLQNAAFDISTDAKITRVEKEDRPYF